MTEEQKKIALETLAKSEAREEKRRENRDVRWTSRKEGEEKSHNAVKGTLASIGVGAREGVKNAAVNAKAFVKTDLGTGRAQGLKTAEKAVTEGVDYDTFMDEMRQKYGKIQTFWPMKMSAEDRDMYASVLQKKKLGLGDKESLAQAQSEQQAKQQAIDAERLVRSIKSRQALQAVDDRYELGKIGEFAQDAGAALGNMAPSLAVGAINPAAGLAAFGVQAAAQGYGQALDDGASHEQAARYGVGTGLLETGTERMFGGVGKFFGRGALDKMIKMAPNDSVKNVLLNTAKGAVGEGTEEVVAGYLDPYLRRATYDPEAKNASFSDLSYQAAIGAVLGGMLGGGSNVLGYRAGKRAAEREQMSAQEAQTERVTVATSQENEGLKRKIGVDGEGQKVVVRREPTESDMPKIKAEYEKSVNGSLLQFVRDVKNKVIGMTSYKLSDVQPREAEDVRELTGIDVSGYEHVLRSNTVEHIEKRHGANGNADHSMANEDDMARIGYVLNNYDSVQLSKEKSNSYKNADNTPAQTIIYRKRVNGDYYVVEAVPDSKAKKLQIVTAYKTKKAVQFVADSLSSQPDVRNEQTTTASNSTVAENGQSVKSSGEHIDNRDYKSVGSRKMNAFSYDNPEVRPYYVTEAKRMQQELSEAQKPNRYFGQGESGLKDTDAFVGGHGRIASADIVTARDEIGLSYKEIGKALDDIIADSGKENNANAKKLEVLFDQNLSMGMETGGYRIPPNAEYIRTKEGIAGAKDYGYKAEQSRYENGEFDPINDDPYAFEATVYAIAQRRGHELTETEAEEVEALQEVIDADRSAFTEEEIRQLIDEQVSKWKMPQKEAQTPYEQAFDEMLRGEDSTKAVPNAETEEEKRVKDFIQSAAVRARMQVKYVDRPLVQKAYYKDGVIYINKNRPMDEGVKVTVAHELYHAMEGTKEHEAIVKLAFEGKDAEAMIAEKIEKYRQSGVELDETGARAEIGAEFIEKALTDEATINQVLLENRTLAAKILERIKEIIAVYKAKKSMKAEEAREYAALLKARRLYEDGLEKLHRDEYSPAGVERARYMLFDNSDTATMKSVNTLIKENKDKIDENGLVSSLKGNEFLGKDIVLYKDVPAMIDELGGLVYRKGLGNVLVTKRGVKDSVAHGMGENKKITFAAVPDVIERGVEIDKQNNWKGRGYDTLVLGGKVEIAGEPAYMGVVLKLDNQSNRYYLHEVLTERDLLSAQKNTDVVLTGAVNNNGLPGNTSVADLNVAEKKSVVKTKKELDREYFTALQNNDIETAQNMVDKAAENAGYSDDVSWRMSHQAPNSKDGFSVSLNNLKTSNMLPNDYWEHPDWYTSSVEEREAFYKVREAIERQERYDAEGKNIDVSLRVYRAVDKTKNAKEDYFRNGDWVTPSKQYAINEGKLNANGYRIITHAVKIKDLYFNGDSIAELGFDDGRNYAYANTKNNRKLLDVATYDSDGKVIPLSKRFNKRDFDIRYALDEEGKAEKVGYRFFDNTFQNTPVFDKAVKEIERSYEHERTRTSEKENIAEARRRLKENGWHKEINTVLNKSNVDGADTDVAMAIISQLNNYETDSAEFGRIMKFAEDYAEKTVESGQFIQSLAKYTRTPEGKTQKAMRDIKREEKRLQEDNPKEWNDVEKKSAKAKSAVKSAQDEAAGEAVDEAVQKIDEETAERIVNSKRKKKELTDAERLAGKIKGQVNKAFAKDKDTVDNARLQRDIINELYRLAKESPLPDKAINVQKKDYVKIMRDILHNQEKYADIWDEAKEIVAKKYKGDAEKMAALEDYFDNYTVPIYSAESMRIAVKGAMDDLKLDVRDILMANKADKTKAQEDIKTLLGEKLGFSELDAETVDVVSNDIVNTFERTLQKKAQKKLQDFLNEEVKDVKKRDSIEKQMMRMVRGGYFSEDEVARIVRKAFDVPSLTTEEVQEILSHYKMADNYAEGSYERRKWEAKAQKIIADKVPKTLAEKNKTARRVAMLLNPGTWWRNIDGNIIFGAAEMVKNVPAGLADMAVSKVTGKRTTSVNIAADVGAYAKGAKRGAQEWWQDIQSGVDTSHNAVREEYQINGGKVFSEKHLYGRLYNKADTVVAKALQLGDRPFYEGAYEQRISEMKRLGYDVESENVQAEAKIYALERVYQNDSKISKTLTEVRNKLGLFGHFLIPFTQTPGNLLDKCIDYSGAGGLARALVQIGQAKKTGMFDQKLFVDRIGRALTGLGTMVFGAFLYANGYLTGTDDDDYKVSGAERLAGKKEYALHIGDNYYTIDWAQPVSAVLIAGAEAHKAGIEADDWQQMAIASGEGIINTLFAMSCLEGLESMMSSYGSAEPADKIAEVMISGVGQYFPTTIRRLNNVIDPYQRQTYDPNPLIKQGKYILSGVPGASYLLAPKYTLEGEVQMKSQGRGVGSRVYENFLVPYNKSKEYHSEVNDELLRIYENTGAKSQFLHYAQKKLDYGDGGKYVLEPEDYNKMQKEIGQNVAKADKEFMRSSVYKSMSDDDKAEALGVIATYYDNKFKEDYAKKNKIDFANTNYEGLKEKLADAGGWANYFAIKEAFPDSNYDVAKKRKEKCDKYGIDYTAYAESNAKIAELRAANSERYTKASEKTEANKRAIAQYLASRNDLTNPQRQVIWQEYYSGKTSETYISVARRATGGMQ